MKKERSFYEKIVELNRNTKLECNVCGHGRELIDTAPLWCQNAVNKAFSGTKKIPPMAALGIIDVIWHNVQTADDARNRNLKNEEFLRLLSFIE